MLRVVSIDDNRYLIHPWVQALYEDFPHCNETPDMMLAKFFAGQYHGFIGYDESKDVIEDGFCLWYMQGDIAWIVAVMGRGLGVKWSDTIKAYFRDQGATKLRLVSKLPKALWDRLLGETISLYSVYEKEI